MNKCLAILVLGVMCVPEVRAVTAWDADNCEAKGGTRVTVGDNVFCRANKIMNWWSSYAWCEGMGGRMPSIAELCPGKRLIENNPCGRTYSGGALSTTPNGNNVWVTTDKMMSRSWAEGRGEWQHYVYCLTN